MTFRPSDGVSLFLGREGNGIPCLYLHGGPGYWSKSFQHAVGGLLSEELEMIYLDQRGSGRSEVSSNGDYSLDRLMMDLEEVRLHFGYEQWYVMGHSFGGLLAVNYADRFPERVKGVILSNSTLDMKESFGCQIRKGRVLLGLEPLDFPTHDVSKLLDSFYQTVHQLREKDLFYRLQFPSLIDKEKLDEIDMELQAKPDFQQYVFSTEAYFQDFREITSTVSVPVLVLSGKYDYAIGPTHQESFQFKHAVYKVLDSGHHPYIENPEEFKNVVSEFIFS
jgi:proline iminopeptidase